MLPEEVFHSGYFHAALIFGHVITLGYLLLFQWSSLKTIKNDLRIVNNSIFDSLLNISEKEMRPYDMLLILFSCNFVGIFFANGLHRQFILWYNFSLPFLLSVNEKSVIKLAWTCLIME
jgi:alpha-1,3-mannosyltransferase